MLYSSSSALRYTFRLRLTIRYVIIRYIGLLVFTARLGFRGFRGSSALRYGSSTLRCGSTALYSSTLAFITLYSRYDH